MTAIAMAMALGSREAPRDATPDVLNGAGIGRQRRLGWLQHRGYQPLSLAARYSQFRTATAAERRIVPDQRMLTGSCQSVAEA